jgi:hypothetical protein
MYSMTHDSPTHSLPIEEALRRHGAGDRSREVLRALNQAAWDAFHAPWEPTSLESTMTEEQPTAQPSEDPNLVVRPFSQDMIQAWMDQAGFMYFQHPTRGLLVDFRMSLKSDRAVTLRVWVSGRNKDILVMNVSSDRRIPPEDFVRALRLCNDWNQEYRWPRAMAEQDYRTTDQKEDPPPAPEEVESREVTHSARFCLDFQVCLSEGIHQAALNTILDDAVATSWDFWKLARDKWGL